MVEKFFPAIFAFCYMLVVLPLVILVAMLAAAFSPGFV
jgi:hypothetical protein